jgi:quinol monooxygenase YgiN
MSISLIVSGIGAIVAAIGGGVLLARCFREPRGDLIAWSVALLGLLISLGAQALGHLSGFDSAMFRAMELGGQVLAPLALILALSEVAAKSTAARFCARLYIPALGVVAVVVLAMDQLAQASFTKAWPDPAVFYQVPPNYVLMFAIGPATALVAIIAVGVVLARSGQPRWNALLPAQLMGGAAALLLAYPALAQLVAYLVKIHLPVGSAFALLCTAAAALVWLAGTRAGRVPSAAAPGRASHSPDGWGAYSGLDRSGDFGRLEESAEGGVYRGDGLYRAGAPGRTDAEEYGRDRDNARAGRRESWQDGREGWQDGGDGWRDDQQANRSGHEDWRADQLRGGYQAPDFATGDFVPGDYSEDYAPADYASGAHVGGAYQGGAYGGGAYPGGADPGGAYLGGDYATGDFATGDIVPGGHDPAVGGWQPSPGADDGIEQYGRAERHDDLDGRRSAGWQGGPADEPDRFAAGNGHGDEAARAQLFGQIAIYTLLEDRVDDFDELTERIVDQVRSREPDTLVFIVHAVPSAPMQRILYEVYRDRSAYQWHTQQPHVQQFEADKRPYVLATNVIELGLQQAKVSPFPSVTDLFTEPGFDTAGFERPDYLRDYGRTSAQPGSGTREYR